jgi:hypothetical protein
MPKKQTKGAAAGMASLNPNDLVKTGLRDDFFATIVGARTCAWDFNGKAEEHGCTAAVCLTLLDEDGETYDNYLIAGDLRYIVPSNDGETPAGSYTVEDYASIQGRRETRGGPKIIPAIPGPGELDDLYGDGFMVVKGDGVPENQDFAFYLQTLGDLEYEDWATGLPGMVGLHGHWQRHPPPWAKKRGGVVNAAEGEAKPAAPGTLVMDEIVERREVGEGGSAASKSKPKAKGKATKAKAEEAEEVEEAGDEDGDEDLQEGVAQAIVAALVKAGKPITKKLAITAAFNAFKSQGKGAQKEAMAYAGSDDSYPMGPVEVDDEMHIVNLDGAEVSLSE